MAGANDFIQWCFNAPDNAPANSLSPAELAALSATLRGNGFLAGIADATQVNTLLRQATMASAALAYLISQSNQDATDDRNISSFANKLLAAFGILTPAFSRGMMVMTGGTGIPTNWLRCDGASVLRAGGTGYPGLFAAIGVLYGTPADSDHFTLPDMRGMFPRGVDNGRGVDPGRPLGNTQQDVYPSHTHTTSSDNFAQPGDVGDLPVLVPGAGNISGASGVGGETRPKNVALNFLIYAGPVGT